MKFSLILPTLNRSVEIKYCLDSINNQTYCNYEVLIIDQSNDKKTEEIIRENHYRNVQYIHTDKKGLSRARNIALRRATGVYFCLIDDDAFYPPNYLKKIYDHIIEGDGMTIYSGYIWDTIHDKTFVNYSMIPRNNPLSVRSVLRYCPSPCLTFPIELIEKIGFFDELFGVGAVYGAGEETDYILRAMKKGYVVAYFRDIEIIHPHEKLTIESNPLAEKNKFCNYAYGIGAMIKKNIVEKPTYRALYLYHIEMMIKWCVKSLLGWDGALEQAKNYFAGYTSYKISKLG